MYVRHVFSMLLMAVYLCKKRHPLTQHQLVLHGRANRKRVAESIAKAHNEIYKRNAFNMSKRSGTVTTSIAFQRVQSAVTNALLPL